MAGVLDSSFYTGASANSEILNFSPLQNGKIIIGGTFSSYNGNDSSRIALISSYRNLDSSFNSGTEVNEWLDITALQDDGKIIIAGSFFSYNGTSQNMIVRINSDGGLDTSFDPGTGSNDRVSAVGIQPNGKILIGRIFTSYVGNMEHLHIESQE